MGTGGKILIIDDDEDFVEMNRMVLEKDGYEVVAAHDGLDCVNRVLTENPDLIVLDVMMSTQVEGFNVCHDLRNREETKDIPIIMVTSVNHQSPFRFDRDETWLPVDVFIEKPVEPQRLLREVRERIKDECR